MPCPSVQWGREHNGGRQPGQRPAAVDVFHGKALVWFQSQFLNGCEVCIRMRFGMFVTITCHDDLKKV